jgi:hypothetical protein
MGTGREQIALTRFRPLLLNGKSRRSPSTASAMRVSEISGVSDLWRETLGDPSVCVAFLDGPPTPPMRVSDGRIWSTCTFLPFHAPASAVGLSGTVLTS